MSQPVAISCWGVEQGDVIIVRPCEVAKRFKFLLACFIPILPLQMLQEIMEGQDRLRNMIEEIETKKVRGLADGMCEAPSSVTRDAGARAVFCAERFLLFSALFLW